jgi:hypothetical protein
MWVKNIMEYPEWEIVTHIAVILLYVYILYGLYDSPGERNVNNLTLLLIAMSIGVLIHQNINTRRGGMNEFS